jgi:mono/diheme cytochrome c family protein
MLALLAVGAVLGADTGSAQTPGPFTAAQADAGRAAYATNCMSCHQANMAGEGDALPLAGKTFIDA